MYRHHCNTLRIALKYANENSISLKHAALDMNVCSKQLQLFSEQLKIKIVRAVSPPKYNIHGIPSPTETMYFFGNKEISKPVYLSKQVGEIVAVSESGLGGTKHIFKKSQVSHIEGMKTIETPSWLAE